jgi:hypothetical protein
MGEGFGVCGGLARDVGIVKLDCRDESSCVLLVPAVMFEAFAEPPVERGLPSVCLCAEEGTREQLTETWKPNDWGISTTNLGASGGRRDRSSHIKLSDKLTEATERDTGKASCLGFQVQLA